MKNVSKENSLVGGGQTHAPVLKTRHKSNVDNADLTLISSNPIVPYSGMLPGYIVVAATQKMNV